jgi:hypothetical protein
MAKAIRPYSLLESSSAIWKEWRKTLAECPRNSTTGKQPKVPGLSRREYTKPSTIYEIVKKVIEKTHRVLQKKALDQRQEAKAQSLAPSDATASPHSAD